MPYKHHPLFRRLTAITRLIKPRFFGGASLYYVAHFFFEGITKGEVGTRAASISYRILMALFPTIIFALSVIPYLPIDNLEWIILDNLKEVMPVSAHELLYNVIEDLLAKRHSTLVSLGFLLGLYYATNTINAYIIEFNSSPILIKRYGFLKGLLVSFLLVLFFAVFIFIAGILLVAGSFVVDFLLDYGFISEYISVVIHFSRYLLAFLIFIFSISVLYYAGDRHKERFRVFSPGAISASFLVIISSLIFAWFVNNFGNYNNLYGSLGSFFVAIIWLYFNNIIIILGFELNTSIKRAKNKYDA
jgi:membrane protein